MKYKALFLDVDGTTVFHGEDNLPSDRRVTQAISDCRKRSFCKPCYLKNIFILAAGY